MFKEENIPFLKKTLYEMDELTEDENIEAKETLSFLITGKISIVERLILMIRIKEQIVGRKKRRFYITDTNILYDGQTSQQEVFIQLVNGELKVTGGLEEPFYPRYGHNDVDVIREYINKPIPFSMGHWEISRNFKELRFNYNSDKRWKDERTYEGIVV